MVNFINWCDDEICDRSPIGFVIFFTTLSVVFTPLFGIVYLTAEHIVVFFAYFGWWLLPIFIAINLLVVLVAYIKDMK